jgi:hypothetical protein
MKYNFGKFNLQCLIEFDLEVDDLVIIEWFNDFVRSGRMDSFTNLCGRQFFWVNYEYALKEMPYLHIKTKDSMYRKFKKYVDIGLMKVERYCGRPFYALNNDVFLQMLTPTSQARGSAACLRELGFGGRAAPEPYPLSAELPATVPVPVELEPVISEPVFLVPELGKKSGQTRKKFRTYQTNHDNNSYSIVAAVQKNPIFTQIWRRFCEGVTDDPLYRGQAMRWVTTFAGKYRASPEEIIYALSECIKRNKAGNTAYFAGILKNMRANTSIDLGAPGWVNVDKIIKKRLFETGYAKSWMSDHKAQQVTVVFAPDVERETIISECESAAEYIVRLTGTQAELLAAG